MVMRLLWKECKAQELDQSSHSDTPQCRTELPSVWKAIKKQGIPENPYATLSQGNGKSISKLLVNFSERCFHFAKSSHIPGFPEPENLMLELFEEGQKFFKCRVCGKVGKRKDNLLAHIETHLPTRPQTCDHCGKLFKTKNSLTSHVSRWHRHDK